MLLHSQLLCLLFLVLNTRTQQLQNAAFLQVLTPQLKALDAIFVKYGFKNETSLRLAGGTVRDILNNQAPKDVDLATTATPEEMKNMFITEGVRMFYSRGEKRATISARVNEKENFQISTLRDKISIGGVIDNSSFTKDWFLDAKQRDFTINAMYLDLEGNLYDYFNGYEDLKNNRVVFIGQADKRIIDEPILILRYFKVFARIAKRGSHDDHDENVLRAIRDNAACLDRMKNDRVWYDLGQIFTGNFVNEIVQLMQKLGLLPRLGLGQDPADLDIKFFESVCGNTKKYSFKPITMVAALLKKDDQVKTFHRRMGLSDFEKKIAYFIIKYKNITYPEENEECFKYFQRMVILSSAGTTASQGATRACVIEFLKLADRETVVNRLTEWKIPELQVNITMLKEKGIVSENRIGKFMKVLREKWFDNAFVLSDDMITRSANESRN